MPSALRASRLPRVVVAAALMVLGWTAGHSEDEVLVGIVDECASGVC